MTLADRVGDAVTPPPAWMFARDRKTHYDVSLPERAAGCVNFMTYTKTPEDVMYILMDCARKAVNESLLHSRQGLSMDVLSSAELLKRAETYPGFDVFYENVKNNSFIRLQNGETTYVQETIGLIEAILDLQACTIRWLSLHLPRLIIRRQIVYLSMMNNSNKFWIRFMVLLMCPLNITLMVFLIAVTVVQIQISMNLSSKRICHFGEKRMVWTLALWKICISPSFFLAHGVRTCTNGQNELI